MRRVRVTCSLVCATSPLFVTKNYLREFLIMKWLRCSFSSNQVSPIVVHGPGYRFDRLIRPRDNWLKKSENSQNTPSGRDKGLICPTQTKMPLKPRNFDISFHFLYQCSCIPQYFIAFLSSFCSLHIALPLSHFFFLFLFFPAFSVSASC